jgi:hypothetical protein
MSAITDAKDEALKGFQQAQQDIQTAQAAHADASARVNYFKGAYEALCELEKQPEAPALTLVEKAPE